MQKQHINTDYKGLKEVVCVILCGGKSSRMGKDKSLLPFGKYNTMIEYQYSRLKPYFKDVYISSKIDKFDFDTKIIYDNSEIYSPMIALKSIFDTLKEEKIFIITVDTPLVTIPTIKELFLNSFDSDACVAKTEEKIHNLCGFFTYNLYNNITNLQNNDIHKVNYLLKISNTKYINFPSNDEFININEPYDYESCLKLI